MKSNVDAVREIFVSTTIFYGLKCVLMRLMIFHLLQKIQVVNTQLYKVYNYSKKLYKYIYFPQTGLLINCIKKLFNYVLSI